LIEFKTDAHAPATRVHDDASYYPPGLIDAWKKKDRSRAFEKKAQA